MVSRYTTLVPSLELRIGPGYLRQASALACEGSVCRPIEGRKEASKQGRKEGRKEETKEERKKRRKEERKEGRRPSFTPSFQGNTLCEDFKRYWGG